MRRLPSFWGPGFDWTPDHNWGGSGMIALQEMLLHTPGGEPLLLSAWCKDWDVDFRLWAPGRKVIEVVYRDGHLESIKPSGLKQMPHAEREARTSPYRSLLSGSLAVS